MDIQFIMFIVFYLWLVLSERLMVYHVHVFQISIQVWKLICSGSFTLFSLRSSSIWVIMHELLQSVFIMKILTCKFIFYSPVNVQASEHPHKVS